MKMLLQHNSWSCLPTAFAMALDVLPKDILQFCEHDGSEIIWPELAEPHNRRAFGLHEMIDYCVSQLVYPVEVTRSIGYGLGREFDAGHGEERLKNYMDVKSGVLVGGKNHAVAWCHKEQMILDPDGLKYEKDRFDILSFFALF